MVRWLMILHCKFLLSPPHLYSLLVPALPPPQLRSVLVPLYVGRPYARSQSLLSLRWRPPHECLACMTNAGVQNVCRYKPEVTKSSWKSRKDFGTSYVTENNCCLIKLHEVSDARCTRGCFTGSLCRIKVCIITIIFGLSWWCPVLCFIQSIV